ncbi:MAG: Crp/Fnr family transcriptional regulator [Clostridiales Family XIII bacterium]|nr:Crp/Fnr family transcriptional regulator [Clostridiales Family XIII bacterium]
MGKTIEYPSRLISNSGGAGRMEALGEPISVPKNHIFIFPGVVPEHCYVLKSGRVITFEYTSDGAERVYMVHEPSAVFLEGNMIAREAVYAYFRATLPCELIRVTRDALCNAISKDPAFAFEVIKFIDYKFNAAMEIIRQTRCFNVEWNICNLFLVFANRYGVPYDGKLLIAEKVSQQMISNMLGINRITAVRIIQRLKAQRLIEQINGQYCIRGKEQLQKHMDSLAGPVVNLMK